MKIQTSGTELTDKQKFVLTNVLAGFHFANHTELLELNLKSYEKEGKRAKWIAHIRASTDWGQFTSKTISTKRGREWRMNLAVKDALRQLEKQLESAKSKEK